MEKIPSLKILFVRFDTPSVELGLSRMAKFGQKETIKNFKGMAGKSQKAAIQHSPLENGVELFTHSAPLFPVH